MQYSLFASRYLPHSLSSCLLCFCCIVSQNNIHSLFTLGGKREFCRLKRKQFKKQNLACCSQHTLYKLKYTSLPYQATLSGSSSQSPLTRRQVKFVTDNKILLNFIGKTWAILVFRGNPEHGRLKSGDGRGYGMTRRKLLHQFRVYYQWINYHDKKGEKILW